jgi:conjugative transfer region protein TrbK
MSARLTFRLGAIGLAVLAITVAILQARHQTSAPPASTPPIAAGRTPPDRRALEHCQVLGAAGAEDPECLRLWADQRARFLGVPPTRQDR